MVKNKILFQLHRLLIQYINHIEKRKFFNYFWLSLLKKTNKRLGYLRRAQVIWSYCPDTNFQNNPETNILPFNFQQHTRIFFYYSGDVEAPDFWGRGLGFEYRISHNDPDALQDHCVIM